MRVAFIHDWLGTYRGGEKVLEALLELYPDAPVYTLFYQKARLPVAITERQILTPQGIGSWFGARKALLPILPAAIESIDFSGFDLLISSSHCVAKGAIPAPHAKHLCYLHSPMRYAWDQRHQYLRGLRKIPFGELAAETVLSRLRSWDSTSCNRVDQFVANSNFVKQRAARYYARDSVVVPPPIENRFFEQALTPSAQRKSSYLCFGALVGYKRFDLAIEAANRLNIELVIAGSGPEESRLRSLAGKTVRFVNAPNDQQSIQLLGEARALIFPGIEDFGMIPVEAMALGTPVIALGHGGVLDSVSDKVNGILFRDATVESLALALKTFESSEFVPEVLRTTVLKFSRQAFKTKMSQQIAELIGSDD